MLSRKGENCVELTEAVLGRRSIRKFADKPVPEKTILEVIRLATHAPSAGNQQMWHFTVVMNRGVKEKLAETITGAFKQIAAGAGQEQAWMEGPIHAATFFKNAPVVIAVSTTRYMSKVDEALQMAGRTRQEIDELRCRPDLQSVGAAVQTLLLAAYEKGLGTCYMTGPMGARPQLEKILGVSPPASLACFVALGYPDMMPGKKTVKDVSEITTFIR